jgi:hypothetical protein
LPQFGTKAPQRDPQALARDILSQSRFRVQVPRAPSHTWWDTVRDWLGDRWHQLLDAFGHHVRVGGSARVALGDVIVVLLIALVIGVLVRLLLGIAREQQSGAGSVSALAVPANPAALHENARQAADRGEYARAIALLYRAALAEMDVRGLLRDDPARTVNECRRDIRKSAPSLAPPFDRIARAFTAAVYAEDRVTAEQWSAADGAYGELHAVQANAA